MVKIVVGEETQLKLAEDRLTQSRIPSQVGLVIGKLSSSLDRAFVLDLVPTPPNDVGEPACSLQESSRDDKKKGSKGKSQPESTPLLIDKDWVAEHARQVARMLLGGIKVVGIYIWVNESSFKSSTVMVCQTVKAVAEATSLDTDWDERLLIHISYSPMRWSCRNCSLASNITTSSLRPCDFKMGKVLASFQTFKCTYNFDLRLPIYHVDESDSRGFFDILRHAISTHAKELKCAKALVDGTLVTDDEQIVSAGPHNVEFLLPFMQNKSFQACSQKEVVGLLVFSGSISSIAYSNAKEPISLILYDMKEDIIMSLESRLDIIYDEADKELDSFEDSVQARDKNKPLSHLDLQLQRKHCSLSFPRRVFVPWLANIYICDYLQPSETIQAVKDHCSELMSVESVADASTVLELESEAPSLKASASSSSFWDVTGLHSSVSKPDNSYSPLNREGNTVDPGSDRKSRPSTEFSIIMGALLILLVSILMGVILFRRGSFQFS